MSAASFLQLRGLVKRFGTIEALCGIDLDVMRDELLVVLGPTGAGKTTLLRTIAGLEPLDGGSVHIDGADVTTAPPAARDVALVLQNFSLYPNRTVRQNLEFPLRAPGRNLEPSHIDERVAWAADLLKISHLLERPSTRLSGGEMQRVAIGRAIVRRPRVFLMDEPLTNLDAKLRESLRLELVLLRRTLRTPMIFVTHDQLEAMSMGDRVAVLNQGRLLQVGTPREVYERPATSVVARQLGQPPINLIPSRGGLMGVRPEDIDITGGPEEGRVVLVEDSGPTSVLLVRWRESDLRIVVPRGLTVRPGDTIFPRIRTERAIHWPAEKAQ